MNHRLYAVIISLVALLLFGAMQSALAQDIVAGVKVGDEFTYSVTGSYSSGALLADVPEEVINAAASDYFKITIINVSDPDVGYTWLWHFTNGTDLNGEGNVNLETTGNTGPFWPIVSANLTVDQRIHPHFVPPSTFNWTVRWTYTNYTRETNRLEIKSVEQKNETQAIRTVHSDAYFDKRTGMLVQLDDRVDYQNPTFTTTISWKLRETNAWDSTSPGSSPPEPLFSLPVIIAIVVVLALVVAIGAWALSNQRTKARRKEILKKK